MCTAADTAGSQDVLRPDVYQASACNSNLNVCISSISAGRDINADVNVQQSCGTATGQTFPSQLSTVTDRTGETVTAGGGVGGPQTTSGPTRDGTTGNGQRTVDGVTFNESDLIIKYGVNPLVDQYLPTPSKQKAAIGGFVICIICCCCCLILMMMMAGGGGESAAPQNQGPVAPNYSANIAKLKAIATSV
jgi:hypothetical protein